MKNRAAGEEPRTNGAKKKGVPRLDPDKSVPAPRDTQLVGSTKRSAASVSLPSITQISRWSKLQREIPVLARSTGTGPKAIARFCGPSSPEFIRRLPPDRSPPKSANPRFPPSARPVRSELLRGNHHLELFPRGLGEETS